MNVLSEENHKAVCGNILPVINAWSQNISQTKKLEKLFQTHMTIITV